MRIWIVNRAKFNYVGFIYLWTNKINGMKYLGSHKGHINDGYIGSGLRFRAAINKHGIENFDRIIVDFCYTDEEIKQKEQFYLDHYKCAISDIFYNISHTSTGGNMGQDYSIIAKKIADSNHKNGSYKRHSERMKACNPNSGGKARREYNMINGSPNIGWLMSDAQRNEISERMIGVSNPNKDGLVGRLETWLHNPETGEIFKYNALSIAEREHSANHQSVWLHRKNRKKPYRGFYWYVGEEINQIKN